jgi:death-on-curing protein
MYAGFSTIHVDDVLAIYAVIVQDFRASNDPIAPAGVRDRGLLESAVYRQFTGYSDRLKYNTPLLSAASLTYGLCCDHPFHNGNKRVALVSMLVHLDRNELSLPGVRQGELYDTMLAIADHSFGLPHGRRRDGTDVRRSADEEVDAICKWLRRRVRRIERGERVITYRQLRRALGQFNIDMEVKGANHASLYRTEERTTGILRRRKQLVRVKFADIGYRDDGTDIPKSEMKRIREICGLTEANGVDSHAFYSTGIVVDDFVCRYRRVLHRLART